MDRRRGIIRALRWASVPLVALAIQAALSMALTQIVNALSTERLSQFPYGLTELICVGIASFVAGAAAPSHRPLAALIGGASIFFIELLSYLEAIGNGSPNPSRSFASITAFGFVGVALAAGAWLALDTGRNVRADAG